MQNKKYRGHVELVNGTFIDLVNDEEGVLKESVQAVLKGGCRFEVAGSPTEPAQLIYHQSWEGGRTPIGWIATGVTQPMTNKEFFEQRGMKQAA
jgi:hypothetical protein